MAGKQGHRGFGYVRKLPSKRFQASYLGPDGVRHLAGKTFTTKLDAEGWLAVESRLVASGDWRSPTARRTAQAATRVTLGDYAVTWLSQRTLKPRTVALYRDLLERRILPVLGQHQVGQLTPAVVRDWYSKLDAGNLDNAPMPTRCCERSAQPPFMTNCWQPIRAVSAGPARRNGPVRPNQRPSTNWG